MTKVKQNNNSKIKGNTKIRHKMKMPYEIGTQRIYGVKLPVLSAVIKNIQVIF